MRKSLIYAFTAAAMTAAGAAALMTAQAAVNIYASGRKRTGYRNQRKLKFLQL